MKHSYRFAHVLRLVDMVSFTARFVPDCDHHCAGCWRVSGTATGQPFGDLVSAYVGPYEHCTLVEALDLVATVSAWQSNALVALTQVESQAWEQVTLFEVQAE